MPRLLHHISARYQVGGKTGFKASFANKNRGPHDADPGSIP